MHSGRVCGCAIPKPWPQHSHKHIHCNLHMATHPSAAHPRPLGEIWRRVLSPPQGLAAGWAELLLVLPPWGFASLACHGFLKDSWYCFCRHIWPGIVSFPVFSPQNHMIEHSDVKQGNEIVSFSLWLPWNPLQPPAVLTGLRDSSFLRFLLV